jgi:hypothetical protein
MTASSRRRFLRYLSSALAVTLLAAAGCGGPKMAPVTGKVVFEDGRPVPGGKVILHPADDPNVPSAVGEIQDDGTFVTMSTERYGDGARVGRYRVLVQPVQDDYSARKPRPIDIKFSDPATSPVPVFEVKPGDNTLNVTVHPPRK